ncbi:MAG TPA: hypothetical protein VFK52_10750 [Nocardioidaceae bacterium]|nr:hypothetical protein [Nocardioidaceae bacterium]
MPGGFGAWQPIGGGGGSGAVLAARQYQSASYYTHTATTLTAIDATNIYISFTAPSSGGVLVSANVLIGPSVADAVVTMGLLESGTLVGVEKRVAYGSRDQYLASPTWLISGLTSGASKTYTLAAKVAPGNVLILTDSAHGAVVMSAVALP